MNNKEFKELKKEFYHRFEGANADIRFNTVITTVICDMLWNFFLPHLKSNDEIKREAVEESMLLRLSSRVHAMFRDAIDPKSVSGYNEALDDVQDMIQEYLTQQSLDGGDKGKQ